MIQNEVIAEPEVITLSDDEEDAKKPSEILLDGPLGVLWSVGVSTPAMKPSQAKSTAAILSAISLQTTPTLNETSIHSKCGIQFKISFDVYGPNVHFKKSSPGLPNFRIVVTTSDNNVPNEHDLVATMSSLTDKVPLVFGIVSQSDIAFFSLSPISLPVDITMG